METAADGESPATPVNGGADPATLVNYSAAPAAPVNGNTASPATPVNAGASASPDGEPPVNSSTEEQGSPVVRKPSGLYLRN